jgi:SAM-dependent methyltransferase
MDQLQRDDVPYGNDWDSDEEAATYGEKADRSRPWRVEIRDHIARRVATLPPGTRVLELGSGPGLLAHRVMATCANVSAYVLLDFSEAMLALSRLRLAAFPEVSFVRASFKSEDWPHQVRQKAHFASIGPAEGSHRIGALFDCVLSMQAVHELRNKRHALRLYEQVYDVLTPRGQIMICDHLPFDDSAKNTTLYMTEQEQIDALANAGFTGVRVEMRRDSLALYCGERSS